MKTRTGFVSNSSSSSFVLITTKENHDKAMEKLSPYEKAVIKAIMEPDNVFGRKCMVGGEYSDNGGGGNLDYLEIEYEDEDKAEDENADENADEDTDENDENNPYDAWEKYRNEVKKDRKSVFTYSMDW